MTALNIACLRYDHTQALFDGSVRIEGVDVHMHTADIPTQIFEPMIRRQAFDVSELGLTYHLRLLDRGDSPFVALPVFLARTFRHSAVFINTKSGIDSPRDFAGKTIGEFGLYGHDGGIWPKGTFSDEFDMRPSQSRWVIGASDWYMPPIDYVPQPHPADVEVRPVPEGKALGDMLDSGEIHALFSARVPRCIVEGSPNVRRLFPDYEAVERDYYAPTGIFPIMHTLVVRKEVLADNPGLAKRIYAGFLEAKNAALERFAKGMVAMNITTPVPWLTPLLERNAAMFPDDWWPYGIAANRQAIDTFARYFFEQGLSRRRFTCAEIFASDLLDT